MNEFIKEYLAVHGNKVYKDKIISLLSIFKHHYNVSYADRKHENIIKDIFNVMDEESHLDIKWALIIPTDKGFAIVEINKATVQRQLANLFNNKFLN